MRRVVPLAVLAAVLLACLIRMILGPGPPVPEPEDPRAHADRRADRDRGATPGRDARRAAERRDGPGAPASPQGAGAGTVGDGSQGPDTRAPTTGGSDGAASRTTGESERIPPPTPVSSTGPFSAPVAATRLPDGQYRSHIALAWSPDGKRLAWACEPGGEGAPAGYWQKVGWLEPATGRTRSGPCRPRFLSTMHLGRRLAFGPAGKRLLVLYGHAIVTLDATTLRLTSSKPLRSWVSDFVVRGSEMFVLFGRFASEGEILRCEAASGREVRRYRPVHGGSKLDVDAGGGRCVLFGRPGEVSLLDLTSGIATTAEDTGFGRSRGDGVDLRQLLRISPDGKTLAATAVRGGVLLLDAASGEPRDVILETARHLDGLDWSPDGRRLAIAHGGRHVTVHDVPSGRVVATLTFPPDPARPDAGGGPEKRVDLPARLRFSPDGRLLAVLLFDGTLVAVPWVED